MVSFPKGVKTMKAFLVAVFLLSDGQVGVMPPIAMTLTQCEDMISRMHAHGNPNAEDGWFGNKSQEVVEWNAACVAVPGTEPHV